MKVFQMYKILELCKQSYSILQQETGDNYNYNAAIPLKEAISILEKSIEKNKKYYCGGCRFYNGRGLCIHLNSTDECADRDSNHTCDIGKFQPKSMNT